MFVGKAEEAEAFIAQFPPPFSSLLLLMLGHNIAGMAFVFNLCTPGAGVGLSQGGMCQHQQGSMNRWIVVASPWWPLQGPVGFTSSSFSGPDFRE